CRNAGAFFSLMGIANRLAGYCCETKTGHAKLCIGLQGFVLLSLSRSHPLLQGNLNQCETEWCNHHFFSVTIISPGED
ncbi:hypothetical protein, partial [Citrobacter freundii]|uniref:hypothetical protein n=1 Tax=Citrobacter freundii TaxID=546 RepID=UPI0019552D97